jgi:hypothetical protein
MFGEYAILWPANVTFELAPALYLAMLKPRPGTEVRADIHGRLTLAKENADAASVSAKEVRPRTFAHQLSETPQPSQLPRVSAGTSLTTML